MGDKLLKTYSAALHDMSVPRSLSRMVEAILDSDEPGPGLDEAEVSARIAAGDRDLREQWERRLAVWDFERSPEWADGTEALTPERRKRAYDRLRIGDALRAALDEAVPLHVEPDCTLIAEPDFNPWYDDERALGRFYWPRYAEYLRSKGFNERTLGSLSNATRMVVERLADPEQAVSRQTKGLVVGHVQSGKTANFTGVAARAIDAGYRLVIVLSGTLNLLRGQTQRRLDKELIGQENILLDRDPDDLEALIGVDYNDDHEWDQFIKFGGRPADLGAFDIVRLTTRGKDYHSLQGGIQALRLEKRDQRAKLYSPVNLHSAAARIAVVKKNSIVLKKLVTDLKQVRTLLAELPVLIIDDESDQASVDTTSPNRRSADDRRRRTAINGHIAELLRMIPRAQYIGYTATPFANVFIDPGDSEDLFPSDYVLSLPRPAGYMGAQELFDFRGVGEDRTFATSNELAFIRGVWEDHDDQLQEALDAFLLSGAIKLYRTRHGVDASAFRHHTMLIHESVRTAEHRELADKVTRMWYESAPLTSAGLDRLRRLYERDFSKVSTARAGSLPIPDSFEELREDIARARQMITKDGPVRVVNGDKDKDYEDVDFDRTRQVWKIIVGGAKLSRGFTVEGLTVSYYRRATKQADTLMQMGRWFGYRPGYADLVRLYLGRDEASGRISVDILEAFKAACLDEEDFREQLRRYAIMEDGKPQITPDRIPPMVRQKLPWLKPTATNKMYNTELVGMTAPGDSYEPKMYPLGPDAAVNLRTWVPVLSKTGEDPIEARMPSGRKVPVKATVIGHSECINLLRRLKWQDSGAQVEPYLRGLEEAAVGRNVIADWLVLFPQLKADSSVKARLLGYGPFTLSTRSQLGRKGALGRIAPGDDRTDVEELVSRAVDGVSLGPALDVGPQRGVILAYPMVKDKSSSDLRAKNTDEADPEQVAIGIVLVAPCSSNDGRHEVRFRAKRARDTETSGLH